jgi:hypothetical protein
MRRVEQHRHTEILHQRDRAHVGDQVVVAEHRPAIGEQDVRGAALPQLVHDVPHVERREKLSLLRVHGLAGLRGGDEQVGLPAQERGGSGSDRRLHPRARAWCGSWMSVTSGSPV